MTTQPEAPQPEAPQPEAQPAPGPRHGLRLFLIWLVLALAADLLIWFVWKPHLPPGDMSDAARHQQFDIAVLAISGAPVVIFVLLYFIYSIVVWRARPGDDTDGEPIYGNTRVQAIWIVGTTVIVLWLFVFGTVELVVPAGAGAGEGPSPIWKLAGTTSSTWTANTNTTLQVQVIGQQWTWTYRYPQFGGMESSELMLPVDTPVTFHVTSLDVIHSFWAYQLGVKADATYAPARSYVAWAMSAAGIWQQNPMTAKPVRMVCASCHRSRIAAQFGGGAATFHVI